MKRMPRFYLIGCMVLSVIFLAHFFVLLRSDAPAYKLIPDGLFALWFLWTTIAGILCHRDETGHWPNLKQKDLSNDKGD